jgi:Flp pilus assembly protein protease CpaA
MAPVILPIIGLTGYAAYTDLKRREIDHWVVISIAIYGLIIQLLRFHKLIDALISATIIFIIVFTVYVLSKGGFGGGDVKLLTALTLFFATHSFAVVALACIIATVYGIIRAVITGQGLKTQLPFAPAIFLSVLIITFLLKK